MNMWDFADRHIVGFFVGCSVLLFIAGAWAYDCIRAWRNTQCDCQDEEENDENPE